MSSVHPDIPKKMHVTAVVNGGKLVKVLSIDLEPNAKAVAAHNDSAGREGDAVCVQVHLTEPQRQFVESSIRSRALRVMNRKVRAASAAEQDGAECVG